jgi:hypothetical protein
MRVAAFERSRGVRVLHSLHVTCLTLLDSQQVIRDQWFLILITKGEFVWVFSQLFGCPHLSLIRVFRREANPRGIRTETTQLSVPVSIGSLHLPLFYVVKRTILQIHISVSRLAAGWWLKERA